MRAVLSAASVLAAQCAAFHADFPPPKLIREQDANSLSKWFEDHVPQLPPPDSTLTAREKRMLLWTLTEYQAAFRDGTVTSAEYTRLLVRRLHHLRVLNTHMVTSYDMTDRMVEQAEAVDALAKKNGVEAAAPWYGAPVAIKGTGATTDFPSSAGSGVLDDVRAVKDCTFVELLRKGHAVIFGKTNVPEFAASWMTLNHRNGVTRNPHSLDLSPGGSSGGSGAAVAARIVPLAMTEDTGGSTRHPASNNGNFGYDPPRNKYANDGNPGITYWNDQTGWNARSLGDILAADAALLGTAAEHERARDAVARAGTGSVSVAFPTEYFVTHTVPAGAANILGVRSVRAAAAIRDGLAAAQDALRIGGFDVRRSAEWPTRASAGLGQDVNVLYDLMYGQTIGGEKWEHVGALCHSFKGQMATWVHNYLGLRNVSVGDIIDDAHSVGKSHAPQGFMGIGDVGAMGISESGLRKLGSFAELTRRTWNEFFDANNVDIIVTPTQYTSACAISEMVGGTMPLDALQGDGSYKIERAGEVPQANYPLLFFNKHIPIPKVVAPIGVDAAGRPVSIELWGRSVPTEADMYDDGFVRTFDVEWMEKAAAVVRALAAAGVVRRVEPATGAGLRSGATGDEL